MVGPGNCDMMRLNHHGSQIQTVAIELNKAVSGMLKTGVLLKQGSEMPNPHRHANKMQSIHSLCTHHSCDMSEIAKVSVTWMVHQQL